MSCPSSNYLICHTDSERQQASKLSSGLHAVTSAQSGDKSVTWDAIGSGTVAEITMSLQTCQPLTFHYLSQLATPKHRKRNGVVVQRKTRSPEIVRTLMLYIRKQYLRLHIKVTTRATRKSRGSRALPCIVYNVRNVCVTSLQFNTHIGWIKKHTIILY